MNSKWYVSWLDILEKPEWLFLMKPFFQQFQNIEEGSGMGKEEIYNTLVNSQGAMEAQKKMQEDIRWADSMFVLVAYKTEPCKRAARLCRQGYACPNYHNSKDRRRSPKIYKYRSTPCPLVKSNDEWGDPSVCEHQENCGYCHTRTEQQFHPEIYKSTRCKDMQQYLFCPRGPFCAFAHDDDEAQIVYDISETQYPDSTSPPNLVSGVIGDKRSRAYTHSGLSLEARARSGSNDSRMRSLSLIDSMQNMQVSAHAAGVHAASVAAQVAAGTSRPVVDPRNRSQSQGSDSQPDPREASPRVSALLTDKANLAAAVQQQQLASYEESNFYTPPGDLGAGVGGVNGHFPPGAPGQVPGQLPAEYNASHASFPSTAAFPPTEQPPGNVMQLNGMSNLLNSTADPRRRTEQAVLDNAASPLDRYNARIIQQHQHQEQQRALINDSLETLKAVNKLTTSLVYSAQKLPLNVLVHMRQQFSRTLDDINSVLAVRKQMSCIVCMERVRDALIHPCSHYVACQDCLKAHKFCPACNELIQRIYNVCV